MKNSAPAWSTHGIPMLLAMLALGSLGRAQAPLPSASDKSARSAKTGDFVFSILPKSLQKSPTLDMTFNTEFTAYGRLLRKASPENPFYYVGQDAGFHQLGWAAGGERSPQTEVLERALNKALATNGFLPASPGHPAGLALIYYWGSHNKPDEDTARDFPELVQKYILERAFLVGGKKFASGMLFSMEWGETAADHEEKMEFLRDQTREELYYVVASAYDYQALARGERKLAWRTTMTVTSAGLAMNETLPTVVASAAPYFGRETAEPEIGARRISREGRVLIGTPTVVEDALIPKEKTPAPDAGAAKR